MHCKQKTTTKKYKKRHLRAAEKPSFNIRKDTFHTAKGYLSEGKRMSFKIQKGTYHAAKRHILKRKKDILKARSLATLMLQHGENQCAIHAHDIKM